jgi:S1-C subfamily serine protease
MQRIFVLALLVFMSSGCAMQKAERQADDACAAQGKRAFLADVRQSGVLSMTVSAHAQYLCVSPNEIAHLPRPFDAEVLLATNIGGVGIMSVTPGSVADGAGLKPNDIVQEFAGAAVATAVDLQSAIAKMSPGSQAIMMVRRGGQDTVLTARF